LHSHLAQHLPHSAAARFLHATRGLSADLEGEELVDAIREANESLVKSIRAQVEGDSVGEGMRRELGEMYAAWVKEWIGKLHEENMVCMRPFHTDPQRC
jgi:U3 small nucleolar RNA-associated protein 6